MTSYPPVPDVFATVRPYAELSETITGLGILLPTDVFVIDKLNPGLLELTESGL